MAGDERGMDRASRRRVVQGLGVAAGALALGSRARAQGGSDKPIWVIVPYAAGGAIDLVGRTVAAELGKGLGQQTMVENRVGAGGNIGAAHVARAAPDGRTLLVSGGSLTVASHFFTNLTYDPLKDLTPVALIGRAPSVLVVAADSPIRTLRDLLDKARAEPGKVTLGHGGVGTTSEHLPGELLKVRAGVDMTTVGYKGVTPALTDVIGGSVTAVFTNTLNILGHVKEKRLRAIAVGSRERIAALPDVPTMAEAGLPDFEAGVWWGLFGPAHLPADVVAKTNRAVNDGLRAGPLRERLEAMNAEPLPQTPEAFRQMFVEEAARWSDVIKRAGLKPA